MDVFELEYFNKRFAELHQRIDACMNQSPAKIEEVPENINEVPEKIEEVPAPSAPVKEEPKKRGRKPAAGQVPFPTIAPVLPPPSEALTPAEVETIPFDPEKERVEALRKEHGIEPLVFNPATEVREADGTIHIMDDLSAMTLQEVAPKFTEIAAKIGRDVALALIKEHAGVASLKDVKPEQYTKLYHIFKKAYHNACQADSLTI